MRRLIGNCLVGFPVLVVVAASLLGIVYGAMGMDIHFTSNTGAYAMLCCVPAVLCVSMLGGFRLRARK
jgi:nucleoside recognition membrane protein YjiH